MQKLVIEGGNKLSGTITINGAKNSVVALLPAAILSDKGCLIKNVPNITDVSVLLEIIKQLNGKIIEENSEIRIDTTNIINQTIIKELSNKLRASYYFMGSLLSKFKHVEIYFPGGCNFGSRQIDYHLKGFEKLGATVRQEEEKFIIEAEELKGATIDLPFPSVGATINILLAAVKAKGKTVINNAAKEPEIENVIHFLKNMGAKIEGESTNCLQIEGVDTLDFATIDVIPDRIEAGTYLIAGALMGDNLKIANIVPKHLSALLETFDKMNITYILKENEIFISKALNANHIDIKTEVYPGFPTDLAQPITVLLAESNGVSHIEENIYANRMGHVEYLKKMGVNIEVKENTETIIGPSNLNGTLVEASDLRAGATLFLAALISNGETTITNVEYILRGYENIVKKLSNVGAKISIKEIE